MKFLLFTAALFLFISCESTLIVENGEGGGTYEIGQTIPIKADIPSEGMRFYKWNNSSNITDPYSSNTAIKLNRKEVTISAEFIPENELTTLTVENGTGSGDYYPGTLVSIKAGTAPTPEHEFIKWEGDVEYLYNDKLANGEVRVLRGPIYLEPYFEILYDLKIINGYGSGRYTQGKSVTVSPKIAKTGEKFDKWSGDTSVLSSVHTKINKITMPATNISLTAEFIDVPQFKLNVENGSGDGSYEEGEIVNVSANIPEGHDFDKWDGDIQFLQNINAKNTTITMPAATISIKATTQSNDLVVSYIQMGEAALNFEQSVTDYQWGTVHMKWKSASGKWLQRGMDHIPDASKYNGQKWHVVRDVYYVCSNISGEASLPNRDGWRHYQCEKGGHCAIPEKGTTTYYAVKGTDGKMTSFVPYKFEIFKPLSHCKEI